MSDGRPNTDDLLGIGADWLDDGQTVDDVMDELRGLPQVPGHRPFVEDDGVCCGFNMHDGCGEPWPCSTVRVESGRVFRAPYRPMRETFQAARARLRIRISLDPEVLALPVRTDLLTMLLDALDEYDAAIDALR